MRILFILLLLVIPVRAVENTVMITILHATGQLFTQPYVVWAVAGIKVGILGLAYPNTALTNGPENVEDLSFGPAVEAANHFIPLMKQEGAQLIIAQTHLGLGADQKLARAVPAIDVIVGGHNHNRMDSAMLVGRTLIVQLQKIRAIIREIFSAA